MEIENKQEFKDALMNRAILKDKVLKDTKLPAAQATVKSPTDDHLFVGEEAHSAPHTSNQGGAEDAVSTATCTNREASHAKTGGMVPKKKLRELSDGDALIEEEPGSQWEFRIYPMYDLDDPMMPVEGEVDPDA